MPADGGDGGSHTRRLCLQKQQIKACLILRIEASSDHTVVPPQAQTLIWDRPTEPRLSVSQDLRGGKQSKIQSAEPFRSIRQHLPDIINHSFTVLRYAGGSIETPWCLNSTLQRVYSCSILPSHLPCNSIALHFPYNLAALSGRTY